MVVGNNKSTATKNAGETMAISIAIEMRPWRCSGTTRGALPNGAHPGLHSKPLDAAIGRVPAPYHPGGSHGQSTKH